MATSTVRPLVAVLAAVPDPRKARGKRHPLGALLTLAAGAMVCGGDRVLASAAWGREQGAGLAARRGCTRARTPGVATCHRGCRRLDVAPGAAVVGRWAQEVDAALDLPGAPVVAATVAAPGPRHGVARDGTTRRGRTPPAVPAGHRLSALGQDPGLGRHQVPVAGTTNASVAGHDRLAALAREGRVVTVEARLTQREGATASLPKGGTT